MHIRCNNSSRSENKIKQLPFVVCRTFDKHFDFIPVSTSYLDPKIQYHENRTFLFCLSIYAHVRAPYMCTSGQDCSIYLINVQADVHVSIHARKQRGNRGSGPNPKNKLLGFLEILDRIRRKIPKLPFNVGPSTARQRNTIEWRFAGGPMMTRLCYSDPPSPHHQEKTNKQTKDVV